MTDAKQEKKIYTIRVEYLVPTTITYQVSALDEKEALREIDKISARKVSSHQNLVRKIKLKAVVYKAHSSTMMLSKTYRNF